MEHESNLVKIFYLSDIKMASTVIVSYPHPNVALVTLNDPKTLNAMSLQMYKEIKLTFDSLASNNSVRSIVITGSERSFCSGMNINDLKAVLTTGAADPARAAFINRPKLKAMQDSISSLEHCRKPVIAAVSGYCIGAGVDLISACDIRYCNQNALISIREVNVGMAADIGTLQRLPKIVGNNSWIREMAFTARNAKAEEAAHFGVFSKVFNGYDEMIREAIKLAVEIAERSPLAVVGCKVNLDYAREHSVEEALEFGKQWSAWALQSGDMMTAIMAQMQKQKPEFPKL